MTLQHAASPSPASESRSLAEVPSPPPVVSQRRLLSWLLAAVAAMTAGFQGIQQILMPGQIEAIDAASKVSNLALVTAVSAITAVLGLLAGGVVSDRTSGRWGRRTPSLVVSAIVSAVLMLAMGGTRALGPLLALYAALWFVANYYQGALTAILPDRVPVDRRGTGSAVMALGMPLGVVLGVNVAAQVGTQAAYAFLAAVFVLATVGLVWFAREAPAAPRERRPVASRTALRGVLDFVSSFRTLDFTLAFIGRALMFFSCFSVTGYTYYILQDHIGVAGLHGMSVQQAVSVLISIQMVGCLLSAGVAGWLADRLGRPKLFVWASSVGLALAFLVPVFSPTWAGMIVLQTCTGLFFGAYLAVDLALMSLVLPDRDAEGRDMAILAVATSGPQILSPLIAGALIASLGYSSLFLFGAVMALLAGLVVFFIKSVR